MTRQFEDVTRDSPRASKVLVVLFSSLIAFVVLALGWQQWVYSQQRADMEKIVARQDGMIAQQNGMIAELKNRQDILRQRHEQLAEDNARQDLRLAREYVSLERYSCDLGDLKKAMDKGFDKVSEQIKDAVRLREGMKR